MAKRNRSTTKNVVQQRIKEGRGQGTLKNYKPWLNIQDVPSLGQENRISGHTTGREHQLLSKLELSFLFAYDWPLSIVDIREQYPLLPHEDTLAIAAELGIKHPADTETNEPIVVTTDFLLSIDGPGGITSRAVAVKYVVDLQDPHVIEKLEIERVYWKTAGVPWCIATECDLNPVFAENTKFLHDYHCLPASDLSSEEIEDVAAALTERISESTPLAAVARECDRTLGLKRGVSLSIAYHLMATRRWNINMRIPIDARAPINFLSSPNLGKAYTNHS